MPNSQEMLLDPFQALLKETNWEELGQQKQSLIKVIYYLDRSGIFPSRVKLDLEGILNWVDFIQDLAADTPNGLGNNKVFGVSINE